MIEEKYINVVDTGSARFLNCISAVHFSAPDALVGVGLSITDFCGRLGRPHVEVYVQGGDTGQKTFLSSEQARLVSAELIRLADLLDSGATSVLSQ